MALNQNNTLSRATLLQAGARDLGVTPSRARARYARRSLAHRPLPRRPLERLDRNATRSISSTPQPVAASTTTGVNVLDPSSRAAPTSAALLGDNRWEVTNSRRSAGAALAQFGAACAASPSRTSRTDFNALSPSQRHRHASLLFDAGGEPFLDSPNSRPSTSREPGALPPPSALQRPRRGRHHDARVLALGGGPTQFRSSRASL